MLETLLTWAAILAAASVSGSFLMHLTKDTAVHGLSWTLPAGFVFLTVYAQLFSLFYKVGALAVLVLFVLCVCMLISLIRRGLLPKGREKGREQSVKAAFCLALALGLAYLTATTPAAYDSSLYHAEAIRWIEEYGVVPGLGNLHFRFAYNSSFLCLQALFSFQWLTGRSLHSVNGLVCLLGICYAVLTQSVVKEKKRQRPLLSDFLKLCVLFYYFEERYSISSPNTDLCAMTTCWFIFTRWTELEEQKETSSAPWCVLTILSVYAMTLKLSCAMLVLLVVYPLVLLIQRKQYRRLWKSLAAGIITVAPWMARSVLISGYLIYPVSAIDLFDVDWKMSADTLNYDRMEIAVWSRETEDVSTYYDPVSQWVPVWFRAQPRIYQLVLIAGLISMAVMLVWIIKKAHQHALSKATLVSVLTLYVCTLTWFFSAPDLRYGLMYPLLWSAFLLWLLLAGFGQGLVVFCMLPLVSIFLAFTVNHDEGLNTIEQDYPTWEVTTVEWEGQTVTLPVYTDQVGYAPLPSTPYEDVLESLELRGDTLKDGFRVSK